MIIKNLEARQLLDSRGTPTIEVEINGFRAIAPSGASTGSKEAVELRDGRKSFFGKSVFKAIEKAVLIRNKAGDKDFQDPRVFDEFMLALDNTSTKSFLGGNTTVAASIAFTKAFAAHQGVSVHELIAHESFGSAKLPIPAANVINGGMHAGNGLNIQEHLIIPTKTRSFTEATQCVVEVYHELKTQLVKKYGSSASSVGDEGGFAPKMKSSSEALKAINKAVSSAGWSDKVVLGVDCAANSFQKNKKYAFEGRLLASSGLMKKYLEWEDEFGIAYFEDPFAENDPAAFAAFLKETKAIVVADDLTATNPILVEKALKERAANALLVKPNQAGLLTTALNACKLARKNNWLLVASHRSGDSEDAFLADFAAGIRADYAKIGAPARGERTAKYNELLRLEEKGVPFVGR